MGDVRKCIRCGKYNAKIDMPMAEMISNLAATGELTLQEGEFTFDDAEVASANILEFMDQITKGNYCICKTPQSINRWRVSEAPT